MLNQVEIQQVKKLLNELDQYMTDNDMDSDQADWFISGYSKCLQDLNVLFGSLQNQRLN